MQSFVSPFSSPEDFSLADFSIQSNQLLNTERPSGGTSFIICAWAYTTHAHFFIRHHTADGLLCSQAIPYRGFAEYCRVYLLSPAKRSVFQKMKFTWET